jgi:hypothetical protein
MRDRASEYRAAGRGLRALLFEERAHALCAAVPAPQPSGDVRSAREALEEVWAWLARTDPREALSPDRLSDPKMARLLDEAVLGLDRPGEPRLVVERVTAPGYGRQPPMRGWVRTGEGAVGRVGEWFERYWVPVAPELGWTQPVGPFADRVLLFGRARPGAPPVCVVFDAVTGADVAEIPLAASGAIAPVAMDGGHFAVATTATTGPCTASAQGDGSCAANRAMVELWQAWPPRRRAVFTAPATSDLSPVEVVATPILPNLRGEPPRPRSREIGGASGLYTPTRLDREFARWAPAAGDGEPALWGLHDLGHGLLAMIWGNSVSLVDAGSRSVIGAFEFPGSPGFDYLVASASGRFIAYSTTLAELGVYDRVTRRNRVLRAPGADMTSAAFSPDEHWVVTGGGFRFGYLWDLASGKLLRTLPSPTPFVRVHADEGTVIVAGFLRQGREAVLQTVFGGDLHRYDLASGRELPWPPPAEVVAAADAIPPALACPGAQPPLTPTSEDGHAYLRDASASAFLAASDEEGYGYTQWVSCRDEEVYAEWPADSSESFEVTPDGRFAVGSSGGPVRSLSDGHEIWPRHAIEPARTSAVVALDREVLVTSPDGRFELRGDRATAAAYLRCRLGHRVLPFSACTERYEWPGLGEVASAGTRLGEARGSDRPPAD